jgi:hypothetical protein
MFVLTVEPAEALGLHLPGWIHRQNAFFSEVAEQHPDRGHVLLDGRRRARVLLDVSRHRDGLDVFQAPKAGALTPVQEPANRMIVRNSGVLVADWDRKKLEEPFGGLRSNIGNDRGNLERFGFGDGQGRSFHTIWGTFAQ